MQNVFFISGIDTGCGKTYVTGLMAKAFANAGISVVTQKLVQTGGTGISEDILEHRRIMGCELFPEDIQGTTCPYVLPYAASPHLAARLANVIIHPEVLAQATQQLAARYNVVLVEGAGGLHVPVTDHLLTISYIRQQQYPLVLVASSKLGSINHSLLSIESCARHGINLKAVMYNHFPANDPVIANESYRVIEHALREKFPNALMYRIDNEIINNNILDILKIVN